MCFDVCRQLGEPAGECRLDRCPDEAERIQSCRPVRAESANLAVVAADAAPLPELEGRRRRISLRHTRVPVVFHVDGEFSESGFKRLLQRVPDEPERIQRRDALRGEPPRLEVVAAADAPRPKAEAGRARVALWDARVAMRLHIRGQLR